jgi:hypothetical protein
MKHVRFTVLSLIFLMVCIYSPAQEVKVKTQDKEGKETKIKQEKNKMKAKGENISSQVSYAYTPSYSTQFAIGNPAHAKVVLDLFKGYENNDFSNETQFADTVMTLLPDGTQLRGRENVIAAFKKMRSGLSSSKFDFSAIVPLKSVDRNEDWVALWGSQDMTSTDGTQTNNWFQQIWRLNKDGKIDYIQFYEAKPPMQQ